MTTRRWAAAIAFVFAAATPAFGQQAAAAGKIKIASGAARDRTWRAAPFLHKVGDVVYESDSLRTGVDGTVGVTLKDDTRISLGPSSEMRLERYVYAPGEGGFGMVLSFVRGVAAYVSGRMAKLAPDSIRLETPASIVGVRGTIALRVEP